MTTQAIHSKSSPQSTLNTAWLDRKLFPFASRFIDIDGHRLHYVDEGQGPVLLFLHANPLWSFTYRYAIQALKTGFRCIAVDYPGFGLSTARADYKSSLPNNSALIEQFIQTLQLENVTFVLHDASVSIGLGVVARQPHWFKGAVIANGFAWSVIEDGDSHILPFIRIVSTPVFGWLIRRFNFLLRYTVNNIKNKGLTSAEKTAFLGAATRQNRHHQHAIFKSILADDDFLRELKQALLHLDNFPVLLSFADNDPTYQAGWLDRHREIFPNHRVALVHDSDHFPFEYNSAQIMGDIQQWYADTFGNE